MAWSSTAPRISEEALYITKMVEKVGQANFFHHFYDSKDFLRNSWKKWKKLAWPTFSTTNFFHHLGLQNGLSPGKSWPGQLFPLFPRISEEVFFTKMVEKVGLDNFFQHFYGSKDFLRNSWKKWKSWPGQLFPLFFLSPKRLESWKKLARTTFSIIFMIPKTSSASKPSEATVPRTMKMMETIGPTNSFHDFCYQVHGNY